MASTEITPAPSDEETAAIMAAVDVLWPKPLAAAPPADDDSVAWRFSGRWWQRDRFATVDRPWT